MPREKSRHRKLADLILDEDVRVDVHLLWNLLVCTAREEETNYIISKPIYEDLKNNFRRVSRELYAQAFGESRLETAVKMNVSSEEARKYIAECKKKAADAKTVNNNFKDEPA